MTRNRVLLLLLSGLSACTTIGPDTEIHARPIGLSAAAVDRLSVSQIVVQVPQNLTVSTDPNEQFPQVDIVWYEDPAGDRKEQVQAIVERGMRGAVAELVGPTKVEADVVVRRFHAVTPKALNGSLPAWHDVTLDITLRDANSGAVIAQILGLNADSTALTQGQSKAALARGQTQKSRIVARIVLVVQQWLRSGN